MYCSYFHDRLLFLIYFRKNFDPLKENLLSLFPLPDSLEADFLKRLFELF